jgi:hypothetical protein
MAAIKIEASKRLVAADKTLKSVIGLDGTLIKLERGAGIYRLKDSSEHAQALLTRKFGAPVEGRKGIVPLYVWKVAGMDIVLTDEENPTLEISGL